MVPELPTLIARGKDGDCTCNVHTCSELQIHVHGAADANRTPDGRVVLQRVHIVYLYMYMVC